MVSRADDPLLARGSLDVAFLCDTVHEIDRRVDYYRKVHRALKPGGRLAVIESLPAASLGAGEHSEGGQVARSVTVREAQDAGFRLVAVLADSNPQFSRPRTYSARSEANPCVVVRSERDQAR